MTTEQAKLEEIGMYISNPMNDDTKEEMIEKIKFIIRYDKELPNDESFFSWGMDLQEAVQVYKPKTIK